MNVKGYSVVHVSVILGCAGSLRIAWHDFQKNAVFATHEVTFVLSTFILP